MMSILCNFWLIQETLNHAFYNDFPEDASLSFSAYKASEHVMYKVCEKPHAEVQTWGKRQSDEFVKLYICTEVFCSKDNDHNIIFVIL